MKKCPGCGRAYSDFVDKCPACNMALNGKTAPANNISSQTARASSAFDQVQQPAKNNAQGKMPVAALVLWVITAISAVVFLACGASVATVIGAIGVNALVGLIPFFVLKNRGKDTLAQIALPTAALAGGWIGIIGGGIVAVVFIVLAFVK